MAHVFRSCLQSQVSSVSPYKAAFLPRFAVLALLTCDFPAYLCFLLPARLTPFHNRCPTLPVAPLRWQCALAFHIPPQRPPCWQMTCSFCILVATAMNVVWQRSKAGDGHLKGTAGGQGASAACGADQCPSTVRCSAFIMTSCPAATAVVPPQLSITSLWLGTSGEQASSRRAQPSRLQPVKRSATARLIALLWLLWPFERSDLRLERQGERRKLPIRRLGRGLFFWAPRVCCCCARLLLFAAAGHS